MFIVCLLLQPQDDERTIGVNTGYVESLDTKIEPQDQEFLLLVSNKIIRLINRHWIGDIWYTVFEVSKTFKSHMCKNNGRMKLFLL